MSINASKKSLAQEIFVRTADENYIAARWCAFNQLNTDFLWLSVHALEKYFKAVLLVNDQTTKSYGHDIVRLYARVKKFSSPLLPDRLEKPFNLGISHWRERSTDAFVEHLLWNGNANNRYAIYGYRTSSEDLHMLDQMVFSVRRLVCQLDERMFPGCHCQTMTNRENLSRQPNDYGTMFMPLDKLISARKNSSLRHAALNLNLPFAPKGYAHEPVRACTSASNTVIIRRILKPLASDDPRQAAEGIDLARWFLQNVQVPNGNVGDPGVAEQFEAAIDAARIKHRLP